jgi:hypothetical protein
MITNYKSLSRLGWPKTLLVVSLGLLLHPVFADESPNPSIKRVYTDQDAPPEIRFRMMLHMVTMEDEDAKELASLRLGEVGFKPDDIPQIHDYLMSLNKEAQVEVDKGILRLACNSEAESLGGLEIRVVYNSFDDLRYAVAAKYLAIASAELASMGYPDFSNMIENYPGEGGSFTTISTDHRVAWGDTDTEIQANRIGICYALRERLYNELQ